MKINGNDYSLYDDDLDLCVAIALLGADEESARVGRPYCPDCVAPISRATAGTRNVSPPSKSLCFGTARGRRSAIGT
jgi:hypothetical protein